jgi:hypothetical protein
MNVLFFILIGNEDHEFTVFETSQLMQAVQEIREDGTEGLTLKLSAVGYVGILLTSELIATNVDGELEFHHDTIRKAGLSQLLEAQR